MILSKVTLDIDFSDPFLSLNLNSLDGTGELRVTKASFHMLRLFGVEGLSLTILQI